MRVLTLSSYDSGLRIAHLLGHCFADAGCVVEFALVKARRHAQVNPHQIEAVTTRNPPAWISLSNDRDVEALRSYDILLLCLEGMSTRRLIRQLAAFGSERPLLISVYPGLVLRYLYDGLSMRSAVDLLWLNSHVDLTAYRSMCLGFGLSDSNARVFGIPSLLERPDRQFAMSSGPVVFFEQSVIPAYHGERLYLAEQLIALSRRNPTLTFLVKARAGPADATLHSKRYALEALLVEAARAGGGWPSNLAMTSKRSGQLLAQASACLTICSTVAAEAIHAGVPTVIIADFGAHEEYGINYFFGSGLMKSFSQISFPDIGTPNPEWVASAIPSPKETVHLFVSEALRLAGGVKKPLSSHAMTAEMSPGLRRRLQEIHGEEGVVNRKFKRHEPWRVFASWIAERCRKSFFVRKLRFRSTSIGNRVAINDR